mgnify:CR=1 FL=1
MRAIDIKSTYRKNLKLVLKQGWNANAIQSVVTQLLNDDILDPKLQDHALAGDFKGFRECHIYADLVIVYKRDKEVLTLYRIGRHQDLFKGY